MLEPKFDLSVGEGVPLGQLLCFTAVSRGNKAKALESALEPLHRFVYGRPGASGERKYALAAFQGFPPSMMPEVQEKLRNLVKAKLGDMVKALGMRVRVSDPHAEVVRGVLAFLMKPQEEGKAKADPGKPSSARKRSRSLSAAPHEQVAGDTKTADVNERPGRRDDAAKMKAKAEAEEPRPKRARKEEAPSAAAATLAVDKSAVVAAAASPSEDAVRVQVYRRVLAMTPEERATLGVKQLRTELEALFKVRDGALKPYKGIVAETASDCVRALMEAEERARAGLSGAQALSAPAPQPDTAEGKTDSSAEVEANGPKALLEPTADTVLPSQ